MSAAKKKKDRKTCCKDKLQLALEQLQLIKQEAQEVFKSVSKSQDKEPTNGN